MRKTKLAIFGLIAAILTVSPLYAQTDKEGKDGFKEKIYKELNLSAEQQKKLEENRKGQREKMKEIFSAMKEKQAQLQQELKKTDVKEASVEPIVSEIKSLQGKLMDLKIKGIFAVKETLTPEQFAKFQEMTKKQLEKKKKVFKGLRDRSRDKKCCQRQGNQAGGVISD
ncbi:MAG: periplasmic heavy metal sensor [Candidatus Omnitrophica bacterium]|nr:periplasmic heavy metal sensor [Candidatus Omnitrophota bacterium]